MDKAIPKLSGAVHSKICLHIVNMADIKRFVKRIALFLVFAAANLFAVSEAQLTFSSGWGKRSRDDEIAINLDEQLLQ
ncbi:jg10118 [Pararge aegeria aegeria]|uniref:Jg10118 protein n=1 Tax=Pararge aegeria aegeria TaxID=348720 RepID=A0A8S4RRB8_9NEOP|nr:jg10118 [Pararge aegeria aegeria]